MGSPPEDRPDGADRSQETRSSGSGVSPPTTPLTSAGVGTPPPRREPRPAAFAPGQVLADRYRIVRYIARGGMGEVYDAEDQALKEHVALKTIRPETAEDTRAIERFKREIHVARKVTHPNACRLFDLGFHRGPEGEVLFLTMELLSGETLSERLAKGRMTREEAQPIVEQIAAALDAAHSVGIIHRDFKSANVMLVPDPRKGVRAVVTDFGLARGFAAGSSDSVSSISETGAVLGTPAYMAPEQVEGRELTPAADIYALGIVMYEMLAGARPFEGGSAFSVAARRLTEAPVSPRRFVPDLDPVWESVTLRCLQRDPTARFASAGDVVTALRSQRADLETREVGGATSPLGALRRRPGRAAVVAGAVLLAAGAVYLTRPLWLRAPGAPGAAAPAAAAPVKPRRAVAVMGFKNVTGRPDAAWLSTAISEMLTSELAAGGALRTVPGDEVAAVRRDLGLKDAETLPKEVAARVGRNLGADLLVLGSHTAIAGAGGNLLQINLRLQNASSGEVVASGTASGTQQQLFDLVSRAAKPLRETLGLQTVSAAQALEVEASLPSHPRAAQLYAEGLARLRALDALGAQDSLEKAAEGDPKHPLIRAALAEALSKLGYMAKAREEARTAVTLSEGLPQEFKDFVAARYAEIAQDWDKAIAGYASLFERFPDNVEYGLRLAGAQVDGSRPKEAIVTLDRLRKLPAPASEDPRIDVAQARACYRLGDVKQQETLAARAAERARALGAGLLVARARVVEGDALDRQGQYTKAMAALEEARGLYEAAGDQAGLASVLNHMAISYYNRGDRDGARRLFEKSLELSRKVGDRLTSAVLLKNLGNVLLEQGQLAKAQVYYDDALSTFQAVGAKRDGAITLRDVGVRLHLNGDLAGAQQRYEKALAIFGEMGEKGEVALTLTNLGEIMYARGNLGAAKEMHEESLALNREIGEKGGAAYDIYRLGEVFVARNDLSVAREKLDQALALQQEIKDRLGAAQTQVGLALAALAAGDTARGESLARQAEETLRAEEAGDVVASAQAVLIECLLRQGKAAEARDLLGKVEPGWAEIESRDVRLAASIAAARVKAASGKPGDLAAARRDLEAALRDARAHGFVPSEYEARLALGELDAASGGSAGRAGLAALAKEAEAKGFHLVAERARQLGEKS